MNNKYSNFNLDSCFAEHSSLNDLKQSWCSQNVSSLSMFAELGKLIDNHSSCLPQTVSFPLDPDIAYLSQPGLFLPHRLCICLHFSGWRIIPPGQFLSGILLLFSLFSPGCLAASFQSCARTFVMCVWVGGWEKGISRGRTDRRRRRKKRKRDGRTREQRGPCKAAKAFPAIVSSLGPTWGARSLLHLFSLTSSFSSCSACFYMEHES